jgi:hypothetical protein
MPAKKIPGDPMNKLFLLAILYCFSPAHAEEPKVPAPDNEEAKMQVEIDPSAYQFNKLPKSKNAAVKKKKKGKAREHVPGKAARESVFDKVKELGSFVSKYDELEKDLLYIRARSEKLAELKKDYPAFPEKVLASLQKEIQKAEAK